MKNLLFLCAVWLLASNDIAAKNREYTHQLAPDTLKKGKNYLLFSKSEEVESVNFSKSKKSKENIIYLRFGFATPVPSSNVTNGQIISSKRYKEDGSIPVFDKIDILKGKYADVIMSKDTKIKNLFSFTGVEYPVRLKLHSGKEIIDLELTEAGEWNLEIDLKNN